MKGYLSSIILAIVIKQEVLVIGRILISLLAYLTERLNAIGDIGKIVRRGYW